MSPYEKRNKQLLFSSEKALSTCTKPEQYRLSNKIQMLVFAIEQCFRAFLAMPHLIIFKVMMLS